MPGLSKEDVKIDFSKGVLTIRGEKKSEEKDEGGETRTQRSYMRRFTVGDDFDISNIKAKMEHGILRVSIPPTQAKEEKPSSINIEG